MEIGPKDLEKGQVVVVRRVVFDGQDRKLFLPEGEAVATLPALLDDVQSRLLARALQRREENSHRGVTSIDEMREILDTSGGFVYTGWSGDPEVEARIKEETKATARVIPDPEFQSADPPTTCIGGGRAKMEVAWARAY